MLVKSFKIQTFSSKTARNKILLSTLNKYAGSTQPNTSNTIFLDSKGGDFNFNFRCESSVIKTLPFFDNLFIIKNAAFIFNFLPNKISISVTFDELGVLNGRTALAELLLDQPWTVTIQK